MTKKEIVARVTNKVTAMQKNKEIHFPENYSPENALKSAYLILQGTKNKNGGPVLESCTQESIANALLDMVVQGLSPAKKQCYFIPYGETLSCMRSYFGTMAVTKRLKNVVDIRAEVVREGDTFKFHRQNGRIVLDEHDSTIESLDGKIVAAYCVVELAGDIGNHVEIMTREQIAHSWKKAQMKNPVHQDFEDQMCKRTVTNRACKYYANTGDDSDLLVEAFNRVDEDCDKKQLEKEVEQQASQAVDRPPERQKQQEPDQGAQESEPAATEPQEADWMDV